MQLTEAACIFKARFRECRVFDRVKESNSHTAIYNLEGKINANKKQITYQYYRLLLP